MIMALLMFFGFLALVALPSILWLYALADATINSFRYFSTKIIWILVLCFFPPLGTVLYFLIGRSQRRTSYPVGRFVMSCIMIVFFVMVLWYLFYSWGNFSFTPLRQQVPQQYQIQV